MGKTKTDNVGLTKQQIGQRLRRVREQTEKTNKAERETTLVMKWKEGTPQEEIHRLSRAIASKLSENEEVVAEVRMVVRKKHQGPL